MRDVMAGVTLAGLNIPQLLGYSRIADKPLVTDLYTAVLAPTAFAMFGSSRHLVVTADSGTAAIPAGALRPLAQPGSAHYASLAGTTALLTAGMLLLARIPRPGFLADFLSRTVLVGFLTLPRLNAPTLALSTFVVAAILGGRRFAPRIPVVLRLVVGSMAAGPVLGFAAFGVATIGPVQAGLPAFDLPHASWDEAVLLLPVATSCFVVIMAQSAATARALDLRHQERTDEDANLLGLAAANVAAAVSSAFVVNGSPTQTAMADGAGARSQLAQIVFAGCGVVVLWLLTSPLQYLPGCVLAAIVFTIAIGMIDGPRARASSGSRSSRRRRSPSSWSSKAFFWRSCFRCCATCAKATGRMRQCCIGSRDMAGLLRRPPRDSRASPA